MGRIVYDESGLAALKGERKVTALYLGQSFTDRDEFRLRLEVLAAQPKAVQQD